MGRTIIYAHLQAIGIVNDHVLGCSGHERSKNMVWNSEKWRKEGVDIHAWVDGVNVAKRSEANEELMGKKTKIATVAHTTKPNRRKSVKRLNGQAENASSRKRRSKRLAGESID